MLSMVRTMDRYIITGNYAEGFTVTLHGNERRYHVIARNTPNLSSAFQAIAQDLDNRYVTRFEIDTDLVDLSVSYTV